MGHAENLRRGGRGWEKPSDRWRSPKKARSALKPRRGVERSGTHCTKARSAFLRAPARRIVSGGDKMT